MSKERHQPLRARHGVRRRHRLIDPNIGNAFETDLQTVSLAAGAEPPTRLTVIVPSDQAEMNLGQAFAGRHQLDDPGICFRTDTHIDFRTTKPSNRTVVTMGGPATRAVKTWDGGNLPNVTDGYGMGTEQVAYRVADHRVYMLSNTGDIVVRAASDKTAVLQSKSGHVLLNAGHDVAIAGGDKVILGAGGFHVDAPAWNTPWHKNTSAENFSAASGIAGAVAGIAAGAVATMAGISPPIQVGKDLEPGTTVKPPTSPIFQKVSIAFGALAELAWLGGKNVRVVAKEIAGISAGASANMWGNLSATVASAGIGVVMGTIADVLGAVHAGIFGGLEAGICSLRKVIVNSNYGAIETFGKEEVAIASNSTTSIQGSHAAHLSSDHDAALYGKRGAYVLSDQHGFRCSPNYAMIATIDDYKNLFDHSEKDITIKISDPLFKADRGSDQELRISNVESHFSYNGSTAININDKRVLWMGTLHTLGT